MFNDTFNNVYVIPDTLFKLSLNTNKTVRHIIHHSWNIVDSGVNTNKNGHHVLHYTWHIVESVVKRPVLLVFNDTVNSVSGITYNMVTSFIGV
jgi:hypothetical protein